MQRSKYNGLQKVTSAPQETPSDVGKVSFGFAIQRDLLVQEHPREHQTLEGLLEWKDLREIP